jgi:hypothetical protein
MADATNGIDFLFNQAAQKVRRVRVKRANGGHKLQPERVCRYCGITFNPKRPDRLKFCSRSCGFKGKAWAASANRAAKVAVVRKCRDCGDLLGKSKILCSACRESLKYKPKPKLTVACEGCGTALVGTAAKRKCKKCISAPYRFARKNKKRAAHFGAAYEPVNPIMVFDRDKWLCRLCGISTPRKLRGTCDPRAPELDHIMPVSLGGEHSYRNTQCACRKCNGAKGAKPLGQMRMFG